MKLPNPKTDTHDTLLALILNRSLTSIEGEVWKDIIGYEGRYQVSNFGRIKSMERKLPHHKGGFRTVRERILRQGRCGKYSSVCLGQGKCNSKLVHRLVSIAFIPNTENKPCVNHIDGNPSNNNAENLEWVTYSENEHHSYKSLGKKPNKTGLGKSGLKNAESKPILCICNDGRVVLFESSVFAAKAIQTEDTYIRKICRRSRIEGRFIEVKGYKLKQINRNDFDYFKNHFLKAS